MSKGYTVKEILLISIITGTIFAMIFANTSYAFNDGSDKLYDTKIENILKLAKTYGEHSLELQEEKTMIVTVSQLVEEGYLLGNEDGNVLNPKNNNKNLNSLRILLKIDKNNKITAKIQ